MGWGVLHVHAICFNRGDGAGWPEAWRDVDYEAQNLVESLKHYNAQGPYDLPLSRGGIGIGSNAASRYETPLALVSRLMLRSMKAAGYDEATIIPIPSSTHTQPGTDFVNRRIADAIALRDSRFTTLPALHFSQPVPQSPVSRRRTQTALHANLRATGLRGARRVVLLDDLMTTGNHLKAAARFLADRDILVRDAFVVARLATDCPENMFTAPVFNLV